MGKCKETCAHRLHQRKLRHIPDLRRSHHFSSLLQTVGVDSFRVRISQCKGFYANVLKEFINELTSINPFSVALRLRVIIFNMHHICEHLLELSLWLLAHFYFLCCGGTQSHRASIKYLFTSPLITTWFSAYLDYSIIIRPNFFDYEKFRCICSYQATKFFFHRLWWSLQFESP